MENYTLPFFTFHFPFFTNMNNSFIWRFPLERPHCGIPLANGRQGVLVWGQSTLRLTVARAGFWDRRAGKSFGSKATFSQVRALLESGDGEGLAAVFAENSEPGLPARPLQIGGGQLEIEFADGLIPVRGELFYADARVEITLESDDGKTSVLTITQNRESEVTQLDFSDEEIAGTAQIRLRPSWDWVGEQLKEWSCDPPTTFQTSGGSGFVQSVPNGQSLALAWSRSGSTLSVTTALDDSAQDARNSACALAESPPEYSDAFWKQYWNDTPIVSLPDAELQKFWELALYKQAGMTPPGGVAAGLQGAWMEEYQLPAWSNDYHFNINVQLIYYPALMTNRAEHFAPLWEMVKKWLPTLRESGKQFFENENALMLPHATDDRCGVVGSFWTGTIDHGCAAWVAQMAWLHYRYSHDEKVLREIAWPLLNGAFEGYWAMKEERAGKYSLPVTVSPEYRGAQMNAWGRDASFQLAAWHSLSQILPQAARVLGEPLDARWQEVEEKLPPYALVENQIGLWDGLILEESHRHHSHLAGIWPFCSYEPLTPEHLPIVQRSIAHWNKTGAGMWTGWCLPWASILCSRLELPDAAVAWLKWLDNFTNAGYATRHNTDFSGVAAWDNGQLAQRAAGVPEHENEVMQMDATMGFLIAVCELLVQNRKDGNGQNVIHVLPRLPRRWRELSFDGIATEGGFLIGATVENAHLKEVRATSNFGGTLRLVFDGKLIERQMTAGESLVI